MFWVSDEIDELLEGKTNLFYQDIAVCSGGYIDHFNGVNEYFFKSKDDAEYVANIMRELV